MNCTLHPEAAASAYCRTCGKALCERCAHSVRGVVYCEDCIATRLHDTMPAPAAGFTAATPVAPVVVSRGPSPGLAFFLGLIPFGIGAFYNGQFIKGIVHALVFIMLVYASSTSSGGVETLFGLLIPLWIFYMAFDAYRTAKALQAGQPAPADPFGLNLVGTGQPLNWSRAPVGAIILIGLGTIFLFNTMGWLHFWWLQRMWPVILIVIGVWLFVKRFSHSPSGETHREQP
jgi:TM2 domain-containing membrane protein YozV